MATRKAKGSQTSKSTAKPSTGKKTTTAKTTRKNSKSENSKTDSSAASTKKKTTSKSPAIRKKTTSTAAKKKAATRKRKPAKLEEIPTSAEELSALLSVEDGYPASSNSNDNSQIPVSKTEQKEMNTDFAGYVKNKRNQKTKKPLWRKLIKYTAAAVLTIVALIFLYLFVYVQLSLPDTEGEVYVTGLSEQVIISRDEFGIPYIRAKNEADAFFGLGYASAADRLWQMEVFRLTAQGRMSEVAGRKTLNIDLYMRSIGLAEISQKTWRNMPEKFKKLMIAYAAGVNAYLEEATALPIEFLLAGHEPEPWEPIDSLHVFGLINLSLSTNQVEELAFLNIASQLGVEKTAYLFPVYPDEHIPFDEAEKLKTVVLPHKDLLQLKAPSTPGENGQPVPHETKTAKADTFLKTYFNEIVPAIQPGVPASNNWAVAPQKTKSKKTLLANDTHLMVTMPSTWMLAHIKTDTFDAAGVLVPGTPVLAIGFNGHVAWGVTMVMGDSQDIFLEKYCTMANGTRGYVYKKDCLPFKEKEQDIHIKNEGHESFVIKKTLHGPLLNDAITEPSGIPLTPAPMESEYGLAHRWSYADKETSYIGFYDLLKAKDISQARQALNLINTIYLNVAYADAENIAWVATGAYPIRKKGRGLLPSPGYSAEYDWQGYHPVTKNPALLNPPEGFIATANNRTIDNSYEVQVSSSWHVPERVERIRELLSKKSSFTREDMQKMQADTVSRMALATKKIIYLNRKTILAIAATDNKEEQAKAAIEMLKNFDGNMTANSSAAALTGRFYHHFTRNVFLDELGPENTSLWQSFLMANHRSYAAPQDHLLGRPSEFWDNIHTEKIETRLSIITQSLLEAWQELKDEQGENWQWGASHTLKWKHDITSEAGFLGFYFNRGPYAMGGSLHTVNVAGQTWGSSSKIWLIPAMRMTVDFSKPEPVQLLTHAGQSGNPASKHYDDMIQPFLDVSNHPLPFHDDNVKKQYTDTLTLLPVTGKQ